MRHKKRQRKINLKIGRDFKATANLDVPMLWFGDLTGKIHAGLLTGHCRQDLKKLRKMIDLVLDAANAKAK